MVWHPDMYDAPQTPSRHASKFSSPRLDWVEDSKGQVWWVLFGWKTCCIGDFEAWVSIFHFSEYRKAASLKNCPHFLISPWVHHISLWSHPILVATPLQPLFVFWSFVPQFQSVFSFSLCVFTNFPLYLSSSSQCCSTPPPVPSSPPGGLVHQHGEKGGDDGAVYHESIAFLNIYSDMVIWPWCTDGILMVKKKIN